MTARLEQAAPANEIYIGEVTYRLVRDAVEVEPVEPLTLKGKSQPVAAYRLISAQGHDGNVRRQDTPVVGRDEELAVLQTAWDTGAPSRQAQLGDRHWRRRDRQVTPGSRVDGPSRQWRSHRLRTLPCLR